MLNRTDILKRLIDLRRSIYNKENRLDSPPSLEDVKIRKELDNIIIEIIGDGYSQEDKEHIDSILLKAICSDISIEMAVVAIKEIVMTYFSTDLKNHNQKSPQIQKENIKENNQLTAAYYKEEYR